MDWGFRGCWFMPHLCYLVFSWLGASNVKLTFWRFFSVQFTSHLHKGWSINLRYIDSCIIFGMRSKERKMRPIFMDSATKWLIYCPVSDQIDRGILSTNWIVSILFFVCDQKVRASLTRSDPIDISVRNNIVLEFSRIQYIFSIVNRGWKWNLSLIRKFEHQREAFGRQ